MKLNIVEDVYKKMQRPNIENKILGALLSDITVFAKYKHSLEPAYFYTPINKMLYNALVDLNLDSMDIDVLVGKLMSLDVFKGYSEAKLKDELVDRIRIATKLDNALRDQIASVKEMAVKRNLLKLSQSIYVSVLNNDDIFDIGESSRKQLSDTFNISSTHKTGRDILTEFHKSYNENEKIIKSGFRSLDKIIYGFEPGTVTIIAGRPSMGKSAFGLNLLNNFIKQGFACPYFSIEMNNKQLLRRLISMNTKIPISELRKKDVYDSNIDIIKPVFQPILKNKMILDDESNRLDDIVNKIRYFKMKHNIDIVIIDYLQLMKYNNSSRSREQEVAYISQSIKNDVARALDIPVILLAQLSRATEQNKNNRPQMSHIRESGSIENDADNIILLHRPDYYDPSGMNLPVQDTELIVAKGRNTGTGIGYAEFDLQYNLFTSIDEMKSNEINEEVPYAETFNSSSDI